VRHLATGAADRFGLRGRGRLTQGAFADIVVIDPEVVIDTATFQDPTSPALGVEHVVVNGVPALVDGRPTGRCPGQALRR